MKYAILNVDDLVLNVIKVDEDFEPPSDRYIQDDGNAEKGGMWDGERFVRKVRVEEPAPPLTAAAVDAETARRLYAAVGATSSAHFDRIQSDGLIRAFEIQEKINTGIDLLESDIADRARFHAFKDTKQAIIDAGKAIQAIDPIPEDYATNESYWSNA